jgi:hypothetical protein
MKRNNPATNQPFKRGDVREDGFVFYNYTNKLKSTGFFMERWLSPESSVSAKVKDKTAKKAKYQRKTNRKSPGFDKLSPRVQSTINQLRHVHDEQVVHQDLSFDDMVEMLVGYELDPADLDLAISHAQPLCFDAKEVFRKVLTI